ncbi:hypothetical protein RUM44_000244 [Polyplax serrata]|uniref:Uncharacterized protein n=1 Tax=Polyplax serrata TaxID=468196 RepID=A0ABR1B5M0_POLSC
MEDASPGKSEHNDRSARRESSMYVQCTGCYETRQIDMSYTGIWDEFVLVGSPPSVKVESMLPPEGMAKCKPAAGAAATTATTTKTNEKKRIRPLFPAIVSG